MLEIVQVACHPPAPEGGDLLGSDFSWVENRQRRPRELRGESSVQELERHRLARRHRQPGNLNADADRRRLCHGTERRVDPELGGNALSARQLHAHPVQLHPVDRIQDEVGEAGIGNPQPEVQIDRETAVAAEDELPERGAALEHERLIEETFAAQVLEDVFLRHVEHRNVGAGAGGLGLAA
jgi:hypothetical protein